MARRLGAFAGLALVVALSACAAGNTAPTASSSSPKTQPSASASSPRSAAKAEAARLVDLVLLPPGARAVSSTPTPGLAVAPETPSSPDLVTSTTWYVVPSSFASTTAWFAAHPPKGLLSSGGGGVAKDHQQLTVSFSAFEKRSGSDYESVELLVSRAPMDSHETGVRLDGQVIFEPTRPATELIPAGVQTVDIRVVDNIPARLVKSATVRGADAQRLITLFNSLLPDTRGAHGCPAEHGLAITLRVVTSGPVFEISDDPVCGGVGVTRNGHRLGGLSDGGLGRAVEHTLGLHNLL